jgi:hypothetical protein
MFQPVIIIKVAFLQLGKYERALHYTFNGVQVISIVLFHVLLRIRESYTSFRKVLLYKAENEVLVGQVTLHIRECLLSGGEMTLGN